MSTTLKHDVRPDMGKNNNTIKINGQLYDAHTGKLMAPADSKAAHTVASGRPAKPAIHSVKHVRSTVRHPAKPSSGHAPSPPTTLMRHAVKKPGPSLKRQHKAQGEIDASAPQPLDEIAFGIAVGQLDEKRLRHAKQVSRSRLISHFPLTSAAANAPTSRHEPPISLPRRPANHVKPAGRTPKTQPNRASATTEMLNRAVERSTSHLQPPLRSKHARLKRRASIGAAVGLSVVVLGFIATQNLNGVRLQMASAKAGFDVSLPGWQPAGYSLGQINYGSGAAAAQFRGPNGSHYTVTQKKTAWDNQALLNNFVAADYSDYRTVAADGHVIYLYGNHNATWISDGVWYVVQSDGSLNDQQLIDLATSL